MIKLYNFDELRPEEILNRDIRAEKNVEDVVDGIIDEVRARGDEALKEYALKFDGAKIDDLQVTQAEIDEAFANMDPYFLETLREAAANIESFHRLQVHKNFVMNDKPGIVLGQKYTPIEKAGVYVPGGTAAYPSTVLMDVIPAKVAGVSEIVMTTPAGKDGKVNPVILAAAAALHQHFAADEAQQGQGDPGNELLKGTEILNNGVDTDPACHRHQGLEPRKHPGNAQHPPPGHAGLVESVGQRHGKRVHGKAHAQQHTVEKEQDIPLHDCFSFYRENSMKNPRHGLGHVWARKQINRRVPMHPAAVAHESRKLKQARPRSVQYVDVLRTIARLLLPHRVFSLSMIPQPPPGSQCFFRKILLP